jgi:hypothetical protein
MFAQTAIFGCFTTLFRCSGLVEKGVKDAKKCGLGKHVVYFAFLMFFGADLFGAVPAVNLVFCKTDFEGLWVYDTLTLQHPE